MGVRCRSLEENPWFKEERMLLVQPEAEDSVNST
jgi:hypothetical protein